MSEANQRQVGGDHYRKHGAGGEQHWDRIARLYGPASYVYFAGQITAYVERYRDKGGIQDLEKARHYLDKLIELEKLWADIKTAQEPKNFKGSFEHKCVNGVHVATCEQDLIQMVTGTARRCKKCGHTELLS